MSGTPDSDTLAREEVISDLVALHRDIEKYIQMLDRGGALHPVTVQWLPAQAIEVHRKILALYATAHPDSTSPALRTHCGQPGGHLPSPGDPGQ